MKALCDSSVISIVEWVQVPKEALDDYNGGPAVPAFQLQLKMIPSGTPTALVQRVGFVGVTPKDSFVTITKEPRTEGIIHCQNPF